MAEEVKIVDVAGGPAAEATLQEILKLMRQRGGSGSGSGSGSSSAAKTQELYTTAVTRGTKTQTKNTGEVKKSTESLNVFSSTLSAMGSAFGLLGRTIGSATGLLTNFGVGVSKATNVTELLDTLPIFGSLLSSASGYFEDSLNTFRQLSTVGGGFGNDMLAMRTASANAGLNLDQFANMVTANASSMKLLGGTTTEGAKRFGQITKQLRSTNSSLMNLGFTQEDVNEGFGDYLEAMALGGRVRGRSDAQLAAGAESYLLEIDKLAKVTGKSRKELQAEMNSRMEAANANVIAAGLTEEGATRFNANLGFASDIMGEDFANALTDMSDGVSQSRFAQVLEANVPGLAELQRQNATGAITQEEYQSRLMELLPRIHQFADSVGAAGVTSLMGAEGTDAFVNATARSRRAQETYAAQQDAAARAASAAAEQKKRDDSGLTGIYANMGQVLQNIKSEVENALIKSEVLPTVGIALTEVTDVMLEVIRGLTENVISFVKSPDFGIAVNNFKTYIKDTGERVKTWVGYLRSDEFKAKIDEFVTSIKNVIGDIKEFGFVGAISKMLGGDGTESIGDMVSRKIGEGLQSIWDNSGLITKIGAGLLALFTGAKIIGALKNGVGSMFGGLFGGGGGAGSRAAPVRGPRGGGAAGKGVAQFAGNVGGGVLSGIAKGLAAFGNPQVAIGGAVLAGVILVIGGAVAGATWLVGKSLPTFAEGMKAFETLDGAKLSAAGKGMLAVAGGMAAFGAGSAVAGLGNLVGGIADGIGALFGVEKANPLEQLLEFQKYTIDEAKVKGNANALVAYSTAMAAYGGGTAASGLGSLVGGIADGITGFFGGETGIPYEDIIKFQGYAFDTEKVKANAAAMVAFNDALTSSSTASAGSGIGNAVGAIGDAIAGFFGGKTPFEKVQEFGAMQLNAEGVKVNAQAMADFANALNAFTGGEAGEINVPRSTVDSLQRLSEMGSTGGLASFATDLNSVATVQGLATNVNLLNSLDADGVTLYNTAMEKLVETLEDLNKVLAEDNSGTFGGGTGVSAASMMESGALNTGSSGTGSAEQIDRLNMLVSQLVSLQTEGNRNTRQTVSAINGNLQLGV